MLIKLWICYYVVEDLTYLEDKKELEEYVLNDMGKVWCGTSKRLRYRAWNFGQVSKPKWMHLRPSLAKRTVKIFTNQLQ